MGAGGGGGGAVILFPFKPLHHSIELYQIRSDYLECNTSHQT